MKDLIELNFIVFFFVVKRFFMYIVVWFDVIMVNLSRVKMNCVMCRLIVVNLNVFNFLFVFNVGWWYKGGVVDFVGGICIFVVFVGFVLVKVFEF